MNNVKMYLSKLGEQNHIGLISSRSKLYRTRRLGLAQLFVKTLYAKLGITVVGRGYFKRYKLAFLKDIFCI